VVIALPRRPALPIEAWLTVAAAALSGISIALRLPFLSVPLITDEGGYAYTAHWMQRGLLLYRDLWFDRPQGIFLLYAAILRLLGESVEAIRLGAALYNAASVVLLYLLGRRLFGRAAGLAAAGLFAAASASPVVEGFTANGELFMNLPVIACLLLAARRRWLLAGIVCALAAVVKPTAVASAAPALVALAWGVNEERRTKNEERRTKNEERRTNGEGTEHSSFVFRLSSLALGGLVGLAPFVAHGIATDPAGYWYAVAGFRVESHSAFSVGEAVVLEFLQTAPSVLVALLPLWLLAGAAIVGERRRRAARGTLVSAALLAGSFAGAAAGGYWYWHYYLGLLPGACLLGGEALARLVEAARRGLLGPSGGWAAAGLAVASVVALAFNLRLVGSTPEQTSWNLYHRPAYLAGQEIARYLRAHTGEHDRIYATFAQADLYYLTGRRCAGRQLYWTEINRVPGAFEHVLRTLDDPAQRPVYIVEFDRELEQPGRASAFWTRVEQLYRREAVIQGFTLYRLQNEAAA
jgi:4-amino-4-deoxy-L-arabinose transferase-like glycosyltransferase